MVESTADTLECEVISGPCGVYSHVESVRITIFDSVEDQIR